MKSRPKITVIVPLFNKADVVMRAVRSVLAQEERNWCMILVDDGSTDGSADIVTDLQDDRIRLFRQANQGASVARNAGLEQSETDLIALLDADDEWHPEFLGTILSLVNDFPNAGWYATGYEMIHPRTGRSVSRLGGCWKSFERGEIRDYFSVAAVSEPPVCSSVVAMKRDLLLSIGGFPVGIHSGEDLLTWAKLAVKKPLAYEASAFATIYVSGADRDADPARRVGQALSDLEAEPRMRGNLRRYISKWYNIQTSMALRARNRTLAITLSFFSLLYYPTSSRAWLGLVRGLLPWPIERWIYRALKRVAQVFSI